ncbi:MAG: hypothetical protein WC529_02360 [Candidatus Margulisiibacteriota bacterium]
MINGVQLDVASVCRSRGGLVVNDPAGITAQSGAAIGQLNDLAVLLAAGQILSDLDASLSAIERFSTNSAIKISQAMAAATGATALEKYFSALQSVCTDDQCSGLPLADRQRAIARLGLLRTAMDKLSALSLSTQTLDRLIAAEADQGDAGVKKTLNAVNFLTAKLAEELTIPQDQLNEAGLNRLIADRCQAGVRTEAPVIAQPIVPPVVVNPQPEPVAPASGMSFAYGVSAIPSYSFLVAGDENAAVEAGPALHDRATLAFNFPGTLKTVQLDYAGLVNVDNGFTSRFTQDQATASLMLGWRTVELTFQGGYLWLNDLLNNNSEHLGALGVGAAIFDRLLGLYGGGIAGTTFGGYGGVRSTYTWQDYDISLSGEVDYSYINSSQVAGTLGLNYSPVSFWGADLLLGLSAGAVYNVDQQAAAVNLGLVLSLQGDILAPQPLRQGGF